MVGKNFLEPEIEFSELSIDDLQEAYKFFMIKADTVRRSIALRQHAKAICSTGSDDPSIKDLYKSLELFMAKASNVKYYLTLKKRSK